MLKDIFRLSFLNYLIINGRESALAKEVQKETGDNDVKSV